MDRITKKNRLLRAKFDGTKNKVVFLGIEMYWWDLISIRCGIHSGLPKCCRSFFANTWSRLGFEEKGPHGQKIKELSWGYVPCPECVHTNNKIAVYACHCHCYAPSLGFKRCYYGDKLCASL